MKFLLQQKSKTELLLLRVLGASGKVVLPAFLPAFASKAQITEIAAYAFSQSPFPLPDRQTLLIYDSLTGSAVSCVDVSDADWERLLSDSVACERLLSLSLPASVQKIGRYAFYNCSRLSALSFYSTTNDLGQGLFTGCSGVRTLSAVVNEASRSSLFEILMELRYPLRVSYYTETAAAQTRGIAWQAEDDIASEVQVSAKQPSQLKYRLIFPEFYENADENTPARITTRDLRGSGLMYRNCFANTQFQIKRYDALFPYAKALEPETVTAELALCRLEVPTELSEEFSEKYRSFLAAHPQSFLDALLKHLANALCSLSDIRALFSRSFPKAVFPALCSNLIDALSVKTEPLPQIRELLPLLMDLNAPASVSDAFCKSKQQTTASGHAYADKQEIADGHPSADEQAASDKQAETGRRRRHFEL